jgi:hypothetical protein
MLQLQGHNWADTGPIVVLVVPIDVAIREMDRMHVVRVVPVLRAGLRPLRVVGATCISMAISWSGWTNIHLPCLRSSRLCRRATKAGRPLLWCPSLRKIPPPSELIMLARLSLDLNLF